MARRDVSLSQSRVYETKAGIYKDKPVPIHRARIKQGEFVRRFRSSLIASLVGGGGLVDANHPTSSNPHPLSAGAIAGYGVRFLVHAG